MYDNKFENLKIRKFEIHLAENDIYLRLAIDK